MKARIVLIGATAAACLLGAIGAAVAAQTAPSGGDGTIAAAARPQIAKIVPGQSSRNDVQALLGAPWRVVQFNDCGMAMDDQADETWEYRGADPSGGYRLHIEFGDDGVVHLVAKIPDAMPGGKAIDARIAPGKPDKSMQM